MAEYKLTEQADTDFEEIFSYGIDRFGIVQAEKYHLGMIARFNLIAQNPLLYTPVDDIREGYRRSRYQSHSIYYRIIGNKSVLIVRILNAQNIEEAFDS